MRPSTWLTSAITRTARSARSRAGNSSAFPCRAWAQKSDIYLLDEPHTGLDRNAREAFTKSIHKLRDGGKLIISSHHELNDVPVIFDHVILINGELVASGATKEIFTSENIEKAFATRTFSGAHPTLTHEVPLLEPFQYEFMQRAFFECLLVGFTNGFLGSLVVIRRMALMADALSHSLLPGLAIAAIFVGLTPAGLLVGGLVAACIVALGGQIITRSSRVKDETAVACLYVVAFALGVMLIKYAKVKVDLDGFLFGNILGVSNSDIWTSLIISAVTLVTLITLQRPLLLTLFETSVARTQGIPVNAILTTLILLIVLAMLSSLQAVGVLLSLGLLILPATTMYLLSDSYQAMSWGGGALGVLGSMADFSFVLGEHPVRSRDRARARCDLHWGVPVQPEIRMVTRALRPRHMHDESLSRWNE